MDRKAKDFICFYRPDADLSLRSSAERGDVEAQAALGRLYFEGQAATSSETEGEDTIVSSYTPAVEQNQVQALKWLTRAARQGHPEAKRLLASMVAKGPGVH